MASDLSDKWMDGKREDGATVEANKPYCLVSYVWWFPYMKGHTEECSFTKTNIIWYSLCTAYLLEKKDTDDLIYKTETESQTE